MPKKINRNAKRLNALFEIIRFVNNNPPLLQAEFDALPPEPSTPTQTTGLFFPREHEDILDDGIVPEDPIDSQLTGSDIEDRIDMFGDMRNPMAILSINQLDKEKIEEPILNREQKILKLIDDNPKKIEDIQKNLNKRSDKHFTLDEAQRITFLSLEDNPELTLADIENDTR